MPGTISIDTLVHAGTTLGYEKTNIGLGNKFLSQEKGSRVSTVKEVIGSKKKYIIIILDIVFIKFETNKYISCLLFLTVVKLFSYNINLSTDKG